MEPWKTNLEPSKLTRSCRGWLWVVQVVTGNSQEEVMIFRYTHTLHHNIYIIITIITTTANIIITMHLQSCTVMLLCAAYGHRQGPPCIAWTDRWRKHPDFALQVTRAQFRLHLQPSSFWTPWKNTKIHENQHTTTKINQKHENSTNEPVLIRLHIQLPSLSLGVRTEIR